MLRWCVLVLAVCVAAGECQTHNTVRTRCQIACNTNPSHPRLEASQSHSQQGFVSLPLHYNTYRPLNAYWNQYGSLQRAREAKIYVTNSHQASGSRFLTSTREQHIHSDSSLNRVEGGSAIRHQSTPQAQRGRQEQEHSYTTTYRHQTGLHCTLETQQRRPGTHTSTSSTTPPFIESSSGLTHYDTLGRRGQGRRRNGSGRVRRPGDSLPGQGKRYRGRQRQRVQGEGFGEAYLRWSEHGIGCSCDECGTQNCNHFTGDCECFENVIGGDCDRCAPDHWGFASCQGCQPCQCGLASLSSQCAEETGQCQCQPGVTGQRCDQCRPGFWNYTQFGCQECLCREGFSIGVGCDPRTGQCQCLPGVIGDNCDGCPYRWVLVDGYGCQECGECVHALLDTTDELSQLIEPTINEFESAAYSFFLHQRLDVINSSTNELKPRVRLLDLSDADSLTIDGPLAALLKEAQALSAEAGIVGERAGRASGDAFQVHVEALKVREHVEAAFALTRDIVQEINKLVIGLETGTGAELGQAISEGEAIVAEIKLRNFEGQNDKVEVELELAKELLEKMEGFFTPVKEQRDDVDSYESRLKTFEEMVKEMIDHIQKAKQKLKEGQEIVKIYSEMGYPQLKKKLEEIKLLSDQTEDNNGNARDLIEEAKDNYANATNNYEMLVTGVEQLRSAKTTLNDTVLEMEKELLEAELPAQRAHGHAQLLQRRAEDLDGLLQDTREVSEKALGAANAYNNIVLAIENAYNASLSANMSAVRAVDMSVGVTDLAIESQERSEDKYSQAGTRVKEVESNLRPQLEQAEADVRTLRDMNQHTNDTLTIIERQLNNLDMETISNDAALLEERAVQSKEGADEAIKNIIVVEERLPKAAEDARLLLKNKAEGTRAIALAYESVERAEKQLPDALDLAGRLRPQKERIQLKGIDMAERLEKLRLTIQKTREMANKIKVGVSFLPNTTIELENPRDLTKASTATKLSTFIKTDQPSGLILFMGSPVGAHKRMRRTTTDDFLALELDRGYVRLTMNLGAGPHTIEYNKLFVADDVWTKITMERTGKLVKLDVSREGFETEPVDEVLPGRFTVFNLDPKVSKIFVGGIPAGVEVDASILSTSFDGELEDLRLNDQFIGLWNFMSNGTNNNYQRGAMERDRFVDLVPPTGLRFNGDGHAAMDTRNGFSFERLFDLQLNFKTYVEDGILFMITGAPGQYIALSMEEGHVIFQFDLGSGGATMRSQNAYNDGQDHRVEVARERNRGVLRIGSETVSAESPGEAELFSNVPDTMYFGGYPGEHDFIDLMNDDFKGCIDGVILSSVTVDLSTSKEILGTAPGCPIEVANLVSWDAHAPGYVQYDSPEGNGLQLVFKFKTDQPDGLILYTATSSQDSYLSLSLTDGALILRDAPGGEITSASYEKYNDSEWHVVIATREHNQLRLDIDDYNKYSVQVPEEAVAFDGPVYFGGVPDTKLLTAAAAISGNFIGCIGDATLNGKIVNFAQSQNQLNAMLEKCPLQETGQIYKPSRVMVETTTEAIPMDSCALPIEPAEEEADSSQGYRFDVDEPSGYNFGTKRNSRIEFQALPDSARADFKFAFGFKTRGNNSIIFYASSGTHQDYITFYIKDGKLVFSFNPGNGAAIMRTEEAVNDGEWHTALMERRGSEGTLYVDGYLKANATAKGDSVFIDLEVPYYYGGIHPDVTELVRANTENTDLSFNGCLRNIRMNNQRVGGQHEGTAVIRCSSNVEPGIFFGDGPRSHVVLRKRFSVGRVFEMTMEIKPRTINGVITSVHGRRDFVMLQLVNGSLELQVDNGKGVITTTYTPSSPWSFCDGKWHSVNLIKNKNIAILVVDGHTTLPVPGKIGATSTDTKNPLFLGSQPFLTRRRGGAVQEKYVGCMREISINKEPVDLAFVTYVGNANAGTCPTI